MARETKHTPGKWSASQGYDNMYNQAVMEISSESTEQFVTIWSGQDYIDDTTESNARLIAASPELKSRLESLSDMVIRKCNIGNDPALIDLLSEVQQAKELIKTIEG